jgi:DUF1365 family protein
MVYLDLDEIDQLFKESWLWSVRRSALVAFRRSDYHGNPSEPLTDSVRMTVETATGRKPQGPIRMLTHLRYAGYCFNPVTFYYCFNTDGETLQTIMAEITNTPWGERFTYVLPLDQAEKTGDWNIWRLKKSFHVSPFMPMSHSYEWKFTEPSDRLSVYMANFEAGELQFHAALALYRRELTGSNLANELMMIPFMTLKVTTAIYWEAFRIWLKRIPYIPHPDSTQITQDSING